jgi:ribosomal protein S18 acetylase RimI-like enzyme
MQQGETVTVRLPVLAEAMIKGRRYIRIEDRKGESKSDCSACAFGEVDCTELGAVTDCPGRSYWIEAPAQPAGLHAISEQPDREDPAREVLIIWRKSWGAIEIWNTDGPHRGYAQELTLIRRMQGQPLAWLYADQLQAFATTAGQEGPAVK